MKGARIAAFCGLLLIAFTFGFAWRDLRDGQLPPAESVKALLTGTSRADEDSPLHVFREAFWTIAKEYYKPIPVEKLRLAAMEGLFNSLGDPYTQFMEPRVARSFADDTRAHYGGVGASLLRNPLGATVRTVFPDGPAAKAGLRPGDTITAVDGLPVGGMQLDQIVQRVRGKENTTVRLTILRSGADSPIELTIRRKQLLAPTVDLVMLPDTKFAYMPITAFAEPTTAQFTAALDAAEAQGVKGLIIDLRWNPGGLLDTAVEMLSRFAENKLVVKVRNRAGKDEFERTSSGFKRNLTFPVVVLVNEDSASAAEIFAGVLQDYKLATLVGTHTYGKAAVQRVWNLSDGSSAKITVARYFLPSGRDLTRRVTEDGEYISGGIKPDVEVELEPITGQQPATYPVIDSQIKKAIEILQAKTGSH